MRKNIDSHQQVCPEAEVDSPFAEMGCKEVQLKRKDVESHTTSAMSHHLTLVMKNLVEAKQVMQKQTDAHKSETEFLKARTDQLQLEADAYRTQTDSVIKTLQTEVSAATRSSIKGAVGEPTKMGKVYGNLSNILDKTPPKVSQFLTGAEERKMPPKVSQFMAGAKEKDKTRHQPWSLVCQLETFQVCV